MIGPETGKGMIATAEQITEEVGPINDRISVKDSCLAPEVSEFQSREQREQHGGQAFTSEEGYIRDFPKDGNATLPYLLTENSGLSHTTIPMVHQTEEFFGRKNGLNIPPHSSQISLDDDVIPSTNNNSKSSSSKERNPIRVEHSKSLKLKSERSAIHDKAKGVWICRYCGWQYPNPHPNARARREHRNLCGKFQNVSTWLENEVFDDEGESDEDVADGTELLPKSVQSDGGTQMKLVPPRVETAELIVSKLTASETTESGNSKGVVTSGQTTLSGEDNESSIQEIDSNIVAQDESTVKDLNRLISSATVQPLEDNSSERNEIRDTKGAVETSAHTGKLVAGFSIATLQASKGISIISSTRHGHKSHMQELHNDDILDHNDSIEAVGRSVEDNVLNVSDVDNLVDTTLNHVVLERSNHTPIVDIHTELDVLSSVKDAKRRVVESGENVRGEPGTTTIRSELRNTLESSTSKQKIEYIDLKHPSSAVGYSKIERLAQDADSGDLLRMQSSEEVLSSMTEVVEDVVRVLKEQKTHDLLCPVCGSCITKRVILRKRKRTSITSLEKWHQEVIEDDSSVVMVTGGIHAASTEISGTEKSNILELGEDEDWGCLACLTFFFRRVRGVRRSRGEALEPIAQDVPNKGAHLQIVQQASSPHMSCMPFALPVFPWTPSQSTQETRVSYTEQLIQKKDKGCLPFIFPEYPLEEAESCELVVSDVGQQDGTVFQSTNREPQNEQIVSFDNEEIQVETTSVILAAPERKDGPSRGVEEESSLGCLSCAFPEFPWGPGELRGEIGCEAGVTKIITNPAVHVQPMREKVTSKSIAEENSCFSFVLPDFRVQRISSINKPPKCKETEEGSTMIFKVKPETSGGEYLGKTTYPEIKEKEVGEVVIASSTTSNIQQLEAANQKDLYLASYEQRHLLQEMDIPSESDKVRGSEIEEARGTSVDRVQDLVAQNSEQFSQKKLDCLSFAFPQFPWSPAVKNEVSVTEDNKEQTNSGLNILHSWLFINKGSSATAGITSTQSQTTRSLTADNVFKGKVCWDCLPAEDEQVLETQNTLIAVTQLHPIAVTHKMKEDQTADNSQEVTAQLKDATVPYLPDVLPKFHWEQSSVMNEPLDVEPEISTVDEHERPQKEVYDVSYKDTVVDERIAQEKQHEFQADQQRICQCFSLPASWPWPSKPKADFDLRRPLLGVQEIEKDIHTSDPSVSLIAAVTTDSVVEVKQDDHLVVATASSQTVEVGMVQPRVPDEPKLQEYLKSIVYGGLDIALASLGVVSSAAGGEAKTLTVFALSLANLVAGFITLFHNIVHLYHYNRQSFEETVGQSLWINGFLAILSFIIFGSVPPLTYGFSFRVSNDRDYKFGATAIASLCCLLLLGLAKARVRRQPYFVTVISLIATGFVASVAGYFAGNYIRRWLQKLGFDFDEPPGVPAQAPAPFSLKNLELVQGSLRSSF